jgi:hypothetical protein
MPSEQNMHRNKPFMTNDTAQGLLVDVLGHNVMGHHRETLICMALNMAGDMVMGVMGVMRVMGTTLGAGAAVDATTDSEGVAYLS